MARRHELHIVDPDGRARAELAGVARVLGYLVEAHAGWDDLAVRSPAGGILLARDADDAVEGHAALAAAGAWLPLVLYAERPPTERVVRGIRHGAFDFLELPFSAARLARALAEVADAAARLAPIRHRMRLARERLAGLSPRERQVLEGIVEGFSNKQIARALRISPRTVEIHRANMMAKLRAHHPAEAARIRFDARLESPDELDWAFAALRR